MQHIHRQRRIGAGLLFVLQIAIGGVGAVCFFRYYDSFTVKAGVQEEAIQTIETEISTSNIQANDKNIAYKGALGTIMYHQSSGSGTAFSHQAKTIETVDIQQETLYLYQLLTHWLQKKHIDSALAKYIVEQQHGIRIVEDMVFLSKYFDTPLSTQQFLPQDVLQPYQTLLREKEYHKVVLTFKNIEQFFISALKKNTRGPVMSVPFFATQQFQYLREQFILDPQDTYRSDIEHVATIFNLNPNLIRSAILGEQVRGFFTYRGVAKTLLKDKLGIMSMGQGSYGIGGIKLDTAWKINKRIQKNYPDIYHAYFTSLDDDDVQSLQTLLADRQDFFGQILYAGALLREILDTRKKAGYDISDQPGVILTLYNIGNEKTPHGNPRIGGADIRLLNQEYSFGGLGMLLFYRLEIYEQQ